MTTNNNPHNKMLSEIFNINSNSPSFEKFPEIINYLLNNLDDLAKNSSNIIKKIHNKNPNYLNTLLITNKEKVITDFINNNYIPSFNIFFTDKEKNIKEQWVKFLEQNIKNNSDASKQVVFSFDYCFDTLKKKSKSEDKKDKDAIYFVKNALVQNISLLSQDNIQQLLQLDSSVFEFVNSKDKESLVKYFLKQPLLPFIPFANKEKKIATNYISVLLTKDNPHNIDVLKKYLNSYNKTLVLDCLNEKTSLNAFRQILLTEKNAYKILLTQYPSNAFETLLNEKDIQKNFFNAEFFKEKSFFSLLPQYSYPIVKEYATTIEQQFDLIYHCPEYRTFLYKTDNALFEKILKAPKNIYFNNAQSLLINNQDNLDQHFVDMCIDAALNQPIKKLSGFIVEEYEFIKYMSLILQDTLNERHMYNEYDPYGDPHEKNYDKSLFSNLIKHINKLDEQQLKYMTNIALQTLNDKWSKEFLAIMSYDIITELITNNSDIIFTTQQEQFLSTLKEKNSLNKHIKDHTKLVNTNILKI